MRSTPALAPLALSLLLVTACGGSSSSSSSGSGGSSTSASHGASGTGGDEGTGGAGGSGGAPCSGPFVKSADVVLYSGPHLSSPAVAWNGKGFAALWTETDANATENTAIAVLDASGNPQGSPDVFAHSSNDTVVGTDGFAAFSEPVGGTELDITNFTTAGASTGAPVELAGDPYDFEGFGAAWSGTSLMGSWTSIGVAHCTFSKGGTVTPCAGDYGLGYVAPSSVVWAGDRFAWAIRTRSTAEGGPIEVDVYEFAADGTPGDSFMVWQGDDASNAEPASIAWTGSAYRLAWPYGPNQLITASLKRDGTADVKTATLDDAHTTGTAPLWDGTGYGALVVTATTTQLTRYTDTGAPNGDPITIGGPGNASMIWTGREYAVIRADGTHVAFSRVGGCGP